MHSATALNCSTRATSQTEFLTLNNFILKEGFKRLKFSCCFSCKFLMLKPERNFKKLFQFPKMCHPELRLCGKPVGGTGSEGPFSRKLGHAALHQNEAVLLPTKTRPCAAQPSRRRAVVRRRSCDGEHPSQEAREEACASRGTMGPLRTDRRTLPRSRTR